MELIRKEPIHKKVMAQESSFSLEYPYLGLLMAPNPLIEAPLPRPRKPRPLGGRLVMHSPGLFVLFGITWRRTDKKDSKINQLTLF